MTDPAPSEASVGEAAQTAVVALMADERTHGGAPVTQIDTPISRVFLAGARAYKMKRAVRTNFLDFSTLEMRRRSCEREIAVNGIAGQLYLGIVPVTRDAGGLRLDGQGPAVEWLTAMRRFDGALECDRLLATGAFDIAAAEKLADVVANLHARAPVATPGEADVLAQRIDQIADALSASATEAATRGAARWRRLAHRRRVPLEPLYGRRIAQGRIRRCHGDLHLGNIVLIDGQPTPFDAIEFNERLATIDVLYDLAMATSDFALRGRPDLGSVVLSRYLARTDDYAGARLMPLYVSMREAVRALVAFAGGRTRDGVARLDAALEVVAAQPAPHLIAIGGVSGSGKTTIARRLAPELAWPLGAVVLRSDVFRKRLLGVSPQTPLPRAAYEPRVTHRVYRRLIVAARRVLRAGMPAILDATFLDASARECVRDVARVESAPFSGLWLAASTETAAARVAARRGDASDATAAVVLRQASRAAAPCDWVAIDAGGPVDAVARDALLAVERRRAQICVVRR